MAGKGHWSEFTWSGYQNFIVNRKRFDWTLSWRVKLKIRNIILCYIQQPLKYNHNSVILRMSKESGWVVPAAVQTLLRSDDGRPCCQRRPRDFPSWLSCGFASPHARGSGILLVTQVVFIITVMDFMRFCVSDKSCTFMLQPVAFVCAESPRYLERA